MIRNEDIQSGLTTTEIGKTVLPFDSIDSTNTFAKTLDKKKTPHGTLIIAEEQTGGRGRFHKTWISPKGENLLFSIILYPEFDLSKTMLLPFSAGLAITDAVDSVTSLSSSCKWPNDLLVNGKKAAGILLESVVIGETVERIVLGVGVNVNQTEFPDDLRAKATSLKLECGREVDRLRLLQRILEEFENRYYELAYFPAAQTLGDWKLKALLFGKKITVLEHEFSYTATAIDVNEDGSLVIQTEDGTKKSIVAGEVSLSYT